MSISVRSLTARPRLTAAVAAAVVVVAAGGTYWFTRGGAKASTAPSYRLVAAATGTVRQSVASTGTIEPAHQDSLNFSASGKVTSVRVSAGDTVKAGQVLATIDSAALKASWAQAGATLANDQAKVSSDEQNSVTSTQLAADEAAVTAAQGQLTSAKSALAGATLRSPIAGVVATVDLKVGDELSGSSGSGTSGSGGSSGSGGAGSTSGSGSSGTGSSAGQGSTASSSSSASAQFLVISTDSWIVNATVDDTEVGLIAKGDQAQITTGGATGAVYGTVASVGVIASSSGTSTSYPVVVTVTGSPKGLHAGASATVALIYKQLTNVLTVPSLAVHVANGASVVYERANGRNVAHPVKTGLSSGGVVQIVSGIAAGEQVVVQVATPARGSTGSRTGTTGRNPGGGFGGGFGGGGFGGGAGGGRAGGGG